LCAWATWSTGTAWSTWSTRATSPGTHAAHCAHFVRESAQYRILLDDNRQRSFLFQLLILISPVAASTSVTTPPTVLKLPVTIFSGVKCVGSCPRSPSARNWSPTFSSLNLLGFASPNFIESGA